MLFFVPKCRLLDRHGQIPFTAFNVASKIQSADSCSRVARSFKEDNKPWPRKRDQSSA